MTPLPGADGYPHKARRSGMRPMLVPIVVRPKHRPKNIAHSLSPTAEKRQAPREVYGY